MSIHRTDDRQGTFWEIRCDFCKGVHPTKGPDPGKISEAARTAGYKTISSRVPGGPRRWICPDCQVVRGYQKKSV